MRMFFFGELFADGVGAGEVTGLLGFGALGDEGVDGGGEVAVASASSSRVRAMLSASTSVETSPARRFGLPQASAARVVSASRSSRMAKMLSNFFSRASVSAMSAGLAVLPVLSR